MARLTLGTLVCILLVVCGTAKPTARVVGGVDATEGQFPHQISLRRNGSHTCGGSIISRDFVLTAAHCVYGFTSPSDYSVRAGSNDRFTGGVVVGVIDIRIHENYGDFLNDVALLKVHQPFIFSKNIQPAKLASIEVPAGQPVIISGWGRLTTSGDIPQKLQWNTLMAISRTQCKEEIDWDTDAIICLAHPVNNGACFGDSGGPAHYNGEVVGISGFVIDACGTRYPDGYAKVYYHVDWIKRYSDYR